MSVELKILCTCIPGNITGAIYPDQFLQLFEDNLEKLRRIIIGSISGVDNIQNLLVVPTSQHIDILRLVADLWKVVDVKPRRIASVAITGDLTLPGTKAGEWLVRLFACHRPSPRSAIGSAVGGDRVCVSVRQNGIKQMDLAKVLIIAARILRGLPVAASHSR